MPTPNDLSAAELEDLVLNDTCACTICRLAREVIRRRTAHVAIGYSLGSLGDLREDSSHAEVLDAIAHVRRIDIAHRSAEGK